MRRERWMPSPETHPGGPCLGLFSGGKDSTYAIHRAMEAGLEVTGLLTIHPPADAFLYHVPGTRLAGLLAERMGIPLVEVDASGTPREAGASSTERGDAELDILRRAIDDLPQSPAGLVVGAVESRFQRDRIARVCEEVGAELVAPLWGAPPSATLRSMVADGFEITVVHVAAAGFDASWLGRRLDEEAIADLADLADRYGIHPMGEGGEYETLVTGGPHMRGRLRFEGEPVWKGDRGRFHITDASLEPPVES